jgi:hypothetical protein
MSELIATAEKIIITVQLEESVKLIPGITNLIPDHFSSPEASRIMIIKFSYNGDRTEPSLLAALRMARTLFFGSKCAEVSATLFDHHGYASGSPILPGHLCRDSEEKNV